jgi:ADP-ribosylglycohydrolase
MDDIIIDNTELLNRIRGCFFGCAVGDAFGAAGEFGHRRPEEDSSKQITTMLPVKHFKLPAGSWTDDTSMMLCLAESIVKYGYFDHRTTMKLYLQWLARGHNSVTGYAFDVGNTCRRAIVEYSTKGYLPARTADEYCQSNGCIMRLAPVPIFYAYDCNEAAQMSGESALTTHAHPVCKRTTELFGWLLAAAIGADLYGPRSKDELLHFKGAPAWLLEGYEPTVGKPDLSALRPVINGDYLNKVRTDLDSTGYVVAGLETALWVFAHTTNFRDGLVYIVNLGGDSDTLGAIYGMLAGAYYGYDSIPGEWYDALQGKDILNAVWSPFIKSVFELNDDHYENIMNK